MAAIKAEGDRRDREIANDSVAEIYKAHGEDLPKDRDKWVPDRDRMKIEAKRYIT